MADEHCNAIDHDGTDMPPRCALDLNHDGKHATVHFAGKPHWRHEWHNKEET